MTNTDPWEPLMTEYGFATEELREQHTEPYRHDCGRLVVSWPHADEVEVLEDADEDGPLGTEHDCDHTDDIRETGDDDQPTSLAALLAKVDALIPTEPDHTSVPDEPATTPSVAATRRTPRSWDNVPETDDEPVRARRGGTSHASCSHPATKAARAKCRRERAAG